MNVVIFGNSGSGKIHADLTLVTPAATDVLDLDMIAWEPNRIAVRCAGRPATCEWTPDTLPHFLGFDSQRRQRTSEQGCRGQRAGGRRTLATA
jgi:hypothetical protein